MCTSRQWILRHFQCIQMNADQVNIWCVLNINEKCCWDICILDARQPGYTWCVLNLKAKCLWGIISSSGWTPTWVRQHIHPRYSCTHTCVCGAQACIHSVHNQMYPLLTHGKEEVCIKPQKPLLSSVSITREAVLRMVVVMEVNLSAMTNAQYNIAGQHCRR